MERGEDRSGSRFICKFCNKKYPCGKSLGGHIRSHVIANSGESEERFEPNKKLSYLNAMKRELTNGPSGLVEFGGASSGYGLRENPKKTWRVEDSSSFPLSQDKICKQCGKGFQSLKALCGHMACHSDKEKILKDDHSWTSENNNNCNNDNNLVMDSHSDTEGEDPRQLTRSKSKIYKKIVLKSPSPYTYSNNNGCSSVSEIDDQEQQEEVAMCLMMLSRDSGNSVVESSDNNSVVLETKSSSIDMRISRKYRSLNDDDKSFKMKFKSCAFDTINIGSKKVESDVYVRNGEVAIASRWNKYDNKKRAIEEEESSKRTIKRASFEFEASKNLDKKSKYECMNCNKSFNSHQALGGHRPCHKKINAYKPSNYESGENSIQNSLIYKKPKAKDLEKRFKPKKIKGHECPICFRIFKSGQALGGHKRSHFIGGAEDRNNRMLVTKHDDSDTHDLIDLNLPAPVEDEDDEYTQFI